MKRHWRIGVVASFVLAAVLGFWSWARAAADVDFTAKAFTVVTINTGSAKKILVPLNDVQIVHLNVRGDATTASSATDYIVVMNQADAMVADLTAGDKLPIFAGGSGTFRGKDCTVGADGVAGTNGSREIHIQAVGNSAQVLLIRGTDPFRNN